VSAVQRARALGRADGAAAERLLPETAGRGRLELARVRPGRSVADAVRELRADPAVLYAEPNYIIQHDAATTDPYYTDGSLWGMYGDATSPAYSYGSQAGEAWAAGHTGSKSVYVGVVDEGIDYNHPDLAANIWTNPYDPVDGRDNDGNGYVDDSRGWDFSNNDRTVFDGSTAYPKRDAHGTHVAGTIGAANGGGHGVVGVNWNVTIIPAKFIGTDGGTTANAVRAIDYLTDLKRRHGLNLRAMNNSWSRTVYSQALSDAVSRARSAGIIVVATAGNLEGNNDQSPRYPASLPHDNIIAVAAVNSIGLMASFSNYGKASVDVAAPGAAVYSTLPRNTYGQYSGTSMAAPHVTGAVALYAAAYPSATVAQIRSALLSTTSATAALWNTTATGGRLDIGKALATPPTRMGALSGRVTDTSGRARSGATVSVVGTALSATTASDGSYRISYVPAGSWTVAARASGYLPQTQSASVTAGATGSRSFALRAGTQTLDTTLLGGAWGSLHGDETTFTFSSNRSGVTFQCSLDGAAYSACRAPVALKALAAGSHTFKVRARTSSGYVDSTPASRTWTVDGTIPTVATVSPARGAVSVGTGARVEATFSEPMAFASLTTQTFTLVTAGTTTPVPALIKYIVPYRKAVLEPAAPLAPGATYVATLRGGENGAWDLAENPLASDVSWSFTTAP
jgi:subtilisin family serine protease